MSLMVIRPIHNLILLSRGSSEYPGSVMYCVTSCFISFNFMYSEYLPIDLPAAVVDFIIEDNIISSLVGIEIRDENHGDIIMVFAAITLFHFHQSYWYCKIFKTLMTSSRWTFMTSMYELSTHKQRDLVAENFKSEIFVHSTMSLLIESCRCDRTVSICKYFATPTQKTLKQCNVVSSIFICV